MSFKMWRHKITTAGQVSIPAEVRDRWGVGVVSIEDHGDRIVLRPSSDDPIDALRGVLAGRGRDDMPSDVAVRRLRDADNAAFDRKWKQQLAGE